MEIKTGVTIAIMVDSGWSYLRAIRAYLGPSDNPNARRDGAHQLVAKVLDEKDERGCGSN